MKIGNAQGGSGEYEQRSTQMTYTPYTNPLERYPSCLSFSNVSVYDGRLDGRSRGTQGWGQDAAAAVVLVSFPGKHRSPSSGVTRSCIMRDLPCIIEQRFSLLIWFTMSGSTSSQTRLLIGRKRRSRVFLRQTTVHRHHILQETNTACSNGYQVKGSGEWTRLACGELKVIQP